MGGELLDTFVQEAADEFPALEVLHTDVPDRPHFLFLDFEGRAIGRWEPSKLTATLGSFAMMLRSHGITSKTPKPPFLPLGRRAGATAVSPAEQQSGVDSL
eukprot:TRINITY_DN20860_c0_g1_i1.p2 TRINITY_DN20860_c0_g1~~TRINITY_DN20860_c0_g1_i1.p2  ORF type:complete len:101 (+),score=14.26 TRINITY_DN20860_c0_g1_i1:254-556(+)